MILIEENFQEILSEVDKSSKKTYLRGVFMEYGEKNRNGRVYQKDEMIAEIEKINDAAKANRHVLGELDHPNTLEIKLENVSHRIISLWEEGNKIYGKAEVLNTPKGNILKALILDGVTVGVSSRGSGSVNESTGQVSKFGLRTVDAVATPSCRSAYPETIQEQLEFYKRGHIVTDLSEAAIYDPAAQKFFAEEMKKFIASLYNKS